MVIWAIIYYFCLMCSYFIIKPVRDEMGIAGGVENLQFLYTGTFFVMVLMVPVFGWISSRFPREVFLPYVYLFFIANILFFYALFSSEISHEYVARGFFIWVSIYNLFVVSVFWSFLSEIFSVNQAKRLFAVIAAGGTAGGIAGPLLTTFLVPVLGTDNLLLVSAAFLAIALLSVSRLHSGHQRMGGGINSSKNQAPDANKANSSMAGGILDGIRLVIKSRYLSGICLLMFLYAALSTFLYFQQLTIIENAYDNPVQRTALFSTIELLTNGLTLLFQLLLTRRIIGKFGIAWALALIPVLLCFGFVVLWYAPVLAVIVVVQVIRRAGNYSVTRPVREILYVVLSREEQYKAKNFIDTAIYRGGDMVSAWVYTGLSAGIGLGLSTIALVAIPVSGIWAMVSWRLGKAHERLVDRQTTEEQIRTLRERLLPPVPETN